MSNIINYNHQWPIFKLSNKEYYDFYLASADNYYNPYSTATSGSCFIASFDFNSPLIYSSGSTSANTIYSEITWNDAVNSGISATTFGFTGIDNGKVTFIKQSGDTGNTALLSAMTGTTLVIPSSDTRFFMTRVTGMTDTVIYPFSLTINTGVTGNYMSLCGGFYQGFYELPELNYRVLPNRSSKGRVYSIWLRKNNGSLCGTGTTLNDIYPENYGFFLYFGTRAENKYWKPFSGLNSGCTSNCTVPSGCTGTITEFCTIPKENTYILPNGYPIDPPYVTVEDTDNQFLIYSRNERGITDHYGRTYQAGESAPCFTGTSVTMTSVTMNINPADNQFLIYCRGCGGCNCGDVYTGQCKTICDYSGYSMVDVMDVNSDVVNNAMGFRVTQDGAIGYRFLSYSGVCTGDTVSAVTVHESYSEPGVISDDVWYKIDVRYFAYDYYDEYELICGKWRYGKLCIYVNGKLKFYQDDFPEFIARKLNTYWFTQLGVPYNISLGGGSVGLMESMTFDGQDPNDLNLHIQNNFAGSFIGDISTFKIFNCDMDWVDIENAYNNERYRYDSTIVRPKIGVYYGKLNMTSISEIQLDSLSFDETNYFTDKYYGFDSGLGYCYVVIPFPNEPSGFRNSTSGCNGFTIPMIRLSDLSVPQTSGYVTYMVYRSFYPTNSNLDMWICG